MEASQRATMGESVGSDSKSPPNSAPVPIWAACRPTYFHTLTLSSAGSRRESRPAANVQAALRRNSLPPSRNWCQKSGLWKRPAGIHFASPEFLHRSSAGLSDFSFPEALRLVVWWLIGRAPRSSARDAFLGAARHREADRGASARARAHRANYHQWWFNRPSQALAVGRGVASGPIPLRLSPRRSPFGKTGDLPQSVETLRPCWRSGRVPGRRPADGQDVGQRPDAAHSRAQGRVGSGAP